MKLYRDKIAKLKEGFKKKYDKTINSNKKTIKGNISNKDNNWVVNLFDKNFYQKMQKCYH